MDSTFNSTFMRNGWDGEETIIHAQTSNNAFEKVPLPVLVSDIVHYQSDDYKIHLGDYSFGLIRVCGRVLSKEMRDKETQLTICDPEAKNYHSCDKLSVVVYGSEQGHDSSLFVPNENDIIVALGKLRKFEDSVSIIAFGITAVEDAEFVQVFKLEVELAKRYYTKNIPVRIHTGEVLQFEGTLLSNIPFDQRTRSSDQNANQLTTYGTKYGGSNVQQVCNAGKNREMQRRSSNIANMSLSKVKLLPESVRNFLEFGMKHVANEEESAPKGNKRSLMFKFLKMLCISNSYLHCSRRISFDFYRLKLDLEQNSSKILVSVASKKYKFFGKNKVSLAYESVHKLVKILLPSYIELYFADSITNVNVFNRYLKFLQLTKGKISLDLAHTLRKQFVQTLLETFTSRIYKLACSVHQIEATESLQFPEFDSLFVFVIEDSDRISRALKCKTKELKLYVANQNYKIEDENFVGLKNETVKKLKLYVRQANQIAIHELVKQLHKSCFNLEHFFISAAFVHFDVSSVYDVLDQLIFYVVCLEFLKECIGNRLASITIIFKVHVNVDYYHDNTWINVLSDIAEFKHWKFNSVKEEVKFDFHDMLKMELEDSKCKLELIIDAFTPMSETENDAFLYYNEYY